MPFPPIGTDRTGNKLPPSVSPFVPPFVPSGKSSKMEVSFYPKSEKNQAAGKVSLQMVISHHGRAKVGIGLSIYLEHWDESTQTVTKKHPSHKAVNDTIAQKRGTAEEIERQLRTVNGYATVQEIAAEFKKRTKPPRREAQPKAPEEAKETVLTMEAVNERWKRENRAYVKNLRKYNQVVTHLNQYRPGVTAEQLDEKFTRGYFEYLASEDRGKDKGKALSVATIGLHALFIRKARKMAQLPTEEKYLSVKIINSEQPDLTKEELRALISVPLSRFDLETERDMFVFQVLVPLRDSHYRILRPHHLETMPVAGHGEVKVINMFQSKTNNPVILPLPPLAERIWEKYGGLFPLYSQQKRNEHLKKIALTAKLTRAFVERKHLLKGYKEEVVPLWKKVSTYTSRHTAATLLLEQTGDESLAGWILGHKNHGITGVTGVYAKKKAAKALPAILAAWAEILGDVELPGEER